MNRSFQQIWTLLFSMKVKSRLHSLVIQIIADILRFFRKAYLISIINQFPGGWMKLSLTTIESSFEAQEQKKNPIVTTAYLLKRNKSSSLL